MSPQIVAADLGENFLYVFKAALRAARQASSRRPSRA
jgi:hypothetical protein